MDGLIRQLEITRKRYNNGRLNRILNSAISLAFSFINFEWPPTHISKARSYANLEIW